jgi:hypothetical protein
LSAEPQQASLCEIRFEPSRRASFSEATVSFELLADELKDLIDVGFDAVLTGFSEAEIDLTVCSAEEAKAERSAKSPENLILEPPAVAVTRRGDLWQLRRHRLLCGDARDPRAYKQLLDGEAADVVFTRPALQHPHQGQRQRTRQGRARELCHGVRRDSI